MTKQIVKQLLAINSPVSQSTGGGSPFDWERLCHDMAVLTDEPVYGNPDCRLKDIFVSQSFRNRTRPHSAGKDGADLLAHLEGYDWAQLKAQKRPLLLFGSFGNGKSSVLKMIAARMSARWKPNANNVLAVYIPLRELAIWDSGDLLQALQRHLEPYGTLELGDLPSPVLFLFDGFDELSLYAGEDDRIRRAYAQLCTLKAYSRVHIVISSRPLLFLGREENIEPETPVIDIQPFDPDQVRMWLDQWNKGPGTRCPIGFDDLSERDLLDVVETPLLLYLVASIFESQLQQARVYRRGEVYRRFFDDTEKGKYRGEQPTHPLPDGFRHVLRKAALVIHQRGDGEMIRLETLREHLPEWEGEAVSKVLRQGNLIVVAHFFKEEIVEERKYVEFTHKSFREFLLAEHLLDYVLQSRDRFDAHEWFRLWRKTFPPEVYAFLRDLLALQPAELLRAISRTQKQWVPLLAGSAHLGSIAKLFADDREFGSTLYRSVCASATALIVRATAAVALGDAKEAEATANMVPYLHAACRLTPAANAAVFENLWKGVVDSLTMADLLPRAADCLDMAELRCKGGTLTGHYTRVGLAETEFADVGARNFPAVLCGLGGASWIGGSLVDCNFDGCEWSKAELVELFLSQVRFVACNFSGGNIRRCSFIECEFDGLLASELLLTDTEFVDCRFSNIVGDWTPLQHVTFKDCTFRNFYWPLKLLPEKVNFVNCRGDLPPWVGKFR